MLKPIAFRLTLALGAAAQLGGVARSAPLPNLSLTCPDENALNQPVESCYGYIYEIPTNERIVVSAAYVWRKAADLAPSDLLQVCTLPREPGAYSSCRDSAGIRRTAFVPKYTVIGSRNSVTVSKTGGDYTDPVTAAENAFAGDTWCVAPQWPLHPCVMAIGGGVFILGETLSIPEGLAVSGNGKGDTMLVADNGMETAVSTFGNVRISGLTIINTQLGLARTTGLDADGPTATPTLAEFHDIAVHVAGAAQNVALHRGDTSVDILDSEISAVGQDARGISSERGGPDFHSSVTLERSRVSAEVAVNEPYATPPADVRLLDSHVLGRVFFNQEESVLDIEGTEVVGNVDAPNDFVTVFLTSSSIKGDVGVGTDVTGARHVEVTDTNVEGNFSATAAESPAFDGVRIHGQLRLNGNGIVRRSYIINSSSTAPALAGSFTIEHSFVEGSQALSASGEVSSSVLVGTVSGALRCTDTYGADYELLNELCQPQTP